MLDKLSIAINPATALGEPIVVGTNTSTSIIANEVWDGHSLSDICMMHDKLTAHSVFNACWFESTYGSVIWKTRWKEWREYATPFLAREDIDDLALPPQKLKYFHTPYSLICEYTVNVYKHIKAL